MERLTQTAKFPIDTFKRCQLCGFTSKFNDICEFRMWAECDEQDRPEPNNILILCKSKKCRKILDEHPRLYREVPWGAGGPGKFMLTCGDCKFRDKGTCTSPMLATNGGPGMEVRFARGLPVVHVSYSNGTGGYIGTNNTPANRCAGYVKK